VEGEVGIELNDVQLTKPVIPVERSENRDPSKSGTMGPGSARHSPLGRDDNLYKRNRKIR
jgi:hypothetical protein